MSDSTRTIPLINAIKRGDSEITSLTLRKPKGGELRGLQVSTLQYGDANSLIKLVPRISSPRIEEHEVADLESEDFAEVAEVVSGFFSTSAMRAYQTTLTS